MYIIGRPINGISLNGLEYLLDEITGEEKEFETIKSCKEFLQLNCGCKDWTDEELEDNFMFVENT